MTDQSQDARPDAEVAVPETIRAAPLDTSYEVELDEHPAGPQAAVYVDITSPEGERRPIWPAHLRTRAGIRKALARSAGSAGHRAGFHGVRSPLYLLRALIWAVVGAVRLAARHAYWASHLESHGLRSELVAAGDSREYRAVSRLASEARKVRLAIVGGELAALVIACVVVAKLGHWWLWAAVLAVVVPALAAYGRPSDRRIVTPAVVRPRFRKLNGDIVLRAYYAARLGDPDREDQRVTFGGPMHRDGEGSRVLVDLPYGKGLKDAMNAKDEIASGLDVTESQVFLHRDPTSYRRHTLWVADRDPLAVPVGRTPLLACKPADVWQPAPLGLNERGALVSLLILWNSILVGALPRQGKTFVARLLALYAALDPWCQLDVFDASGKPDWRGFSKVADSCAFGLTPTRAGLPPEILLDTLERLQRDVQARYARLSELSPDICPEGKLTREIARDPRFDMPVRLLVMDEFQEYLTLGEISKRIAELLVFLGKVAPGAGVSVIGATQKPSGIGTGQVGTAFTAMRDNMAVRFSLRTSSWQVSDMVLGSGAYSEGLDSSKLLKSHKGVGILRGATDDSPTVRTYLADGTDADRILTAARAIRSAAGTLRGHALDQADDTPAVSIVADVLAVLGDAPGMHWEALAPMLRARFPDRHGDATAESVSAMCRAGGVPSVDVKVLGKTLKGCRRADLQRAASQA